MCPYGTESEKVLLTNELISGLFKKEKVSRVPMVHDCNPSYSGGKDQEDQGSRPAWANILETLSQKYPTQKGLVK
jgi:hypothetical protein